MKKDDIPPVETAWERGLRQAKEVKSIFTLNFKIINSLFFQSHLEEHGPFKSFTKLVEHNAHLAVFLNYVISNSDPSALVCILKILKPLQEKNLIITILCLQLFYLVTNLFKEGNAKEMKKWAYEIHSSFLVPCAVRL